MKLFVFIGVSILCIHFCCGQGNAPRPKFPPVFQVELHGIFKDAKNEMEGTLFYDSINNKGAIHLMSQGVPTRSIYRLNDNEVLHISGTDCAVSDLRTDSVKRFFPFVADRNGNKVLARPEELFFFTNSILDNDESSYVYKGKLNSPLYGSNCDVTHIFTKPEVQVPGCDSSMCQPTLTTISITCPNNDGSVKYDFFRFKSDSIDTNAFLPPSGIFCNVKNKKKFPGLPGYFSFSYDLTDGQKGTSIYAAAAHKKVWYDSTINVLRSDEFDAEGALVSSRVFDVNSGVAYTSITSLSTCEMGVMSNVVPLSEITNLPGVFFQKENILSKAVYVGIKRIHGQDYEVWSLSSDDKNIVQEFYFTKDETKQGSADFLKLSHAEIYTYAGKGNLELSASTHLPVNNFVDRSRWEAFDVAPCFTNEQKKAFRLKVDGPPTMKDSKTFQEILNNLYLNLNRASNISAIRLSKLACVFDGVKVVGFTGWLLDKPKVISSAVGKYELDMNEAWRMIDYLASNGKLSLKSSKNGQVVEYKITGIEEDVEHKEEDKNLYSGAFIAGVGFGVLAFGYCLGMFTFCEAERVKEMYKSK